MGLSQLEAMVGLIGHGWLSIQTVLESNIEITLLLKADIALLTVSPAVPGL